MHRRDHGWMLASGAAALALVLLVGRSASPASQQEVEESLTCQCGCGLTVHSCNHLQCPSGEPMKKEIAERLGRGEDRETILAAFRVRYGEKVLSSPTFAGFNWLAWITPFAALLGGGVGVTLVVRRWTRRAPPPPPAPAADAALRHRLERELDALDEKP